ncbi:MAG: iron-sulfur cluster assembly protein [Bacteroidales bacterium]|jgi:FeS assembly SUF system protein|nr:iron-sulfur cluster assembly protein [Bacteroidales bacterium]
MISTKQIIAKLSTLYDPEIPVNIYDLGLIYEINIEGSRVSITMTLTAPNCPVAESLPQEIKESIAELPEVSEVFIKLTFDPPWSMDNLSDSVKLDLGLL